MSSKISFHDIHTGEWRNVLWNSVLNRADPSTFGMVRWHNRGPRNMVTKVVTQPYRLSNNEKQLVGRDPNARGFLNRVANELRQKIAKLQYPPDERTSFLDAYDVLKKHYINKYSGEIQHNELPDVDESDAYHWQVYTWYPAQLRRFEESLPTVKEYGTDPNPDSDVGWFTEHRWDVQNWDYKNRSAGLFPLTTHDNITELTGRCEPLVNFGIKKVMSDYHSGASDLRYACCNGPMGSEGCIIGYPMNKENDDELLYDWFGGKKYEDVLASKMDPSDYLQMAMKYRGVAFENRSDADVKDEEIQTLYRQLSTDFWDNIRKNNGQLNPDALENEDLIVLSKIAEWMYQYNSLVTKQGPRTFPNASRMKTDEFREQMLLYLKKTMGDFIKPSTKEQEEEKRRQEEEKRHNEEKKKTLEQAERQQQKEEQRRKEEEKERQKEQKEQKERKEKEEEKQKKQVMAAEQKEYKEKLMKLEEEKQRQKEETWRQEEEKKRNEERKNKTNDLKLFQDAIESCQTVVNTAGVTFIDICDAWQKMVFFSNNELAPMDIMSDYYYSAGYENNQKTKGLQKIILCDSFKNDEYSRGEVIEWCKQALKKISNAFENKSKLDIDYTNIKNLQKYWYDTINKEAEKKKHEKEARRLKEQREKELKQAEIEQEEELKKEVQKRLQQTEKQLKEEREKKALEEREKQMKEEQELQRLEEERKKAEEQQNRDLEKAKENLKKTTEAVNKEREQYRQQELKKIEYIKKANECIDKTISTMQDPKKNETLKEIIDNWNEIIVCIERNTPNILTTLKITKIETPDFENIPISTQFNWFIPKEYLLQPDVLLLTTFRNFCTAKTTIDVIKNAFVGELRNPGIKYTNIDSKHIINEMNSFIRRRDLYKELDNNRSEETLIDCLNHIYNVNESGHALKDLDDVYQEILKRLKNKKDFNIILKNVLHILKHGNIQSGRTYSNIFKERMKGVRSDDLESLSIKELIDKWNESAAEKDKIVLVDMEDYNEELSLFKDDTNIYIIEKYVLDKNLKLKEYIIKLINNEWKADLKNEIFYYMRTRKMISSHELNPVHAFYTAYQVLLGRTAEYNMGKLWKILTDEQKETIIKLAKEVAKTGENPKLEQRAREIMSVSLKRTEEKNLIKKDIN